MDGEQFVLLIRQEFPELVEELDAEWNAGLVHVQAGVFAAYVRRAVDDGATDLVRRCFAVAERAEAEGDDTVLNAVGLSFLRHLNFQDGKVRREWAFELLPPRLRATADSLGVAVGYRHP